jgi:hypothetical protein
MSIEHRTVVMSDERRDERSRPRVEASKPMTRLVVDRVESSRQNLFSISISSSRVSTFATNSTRLTFVLVLSLAVDSIVSLDKLYATHYTGKRAPLTLSTARLEPHNYQKNGDGIIYISSSQEGIVFQCMPTGMGRIVVDCVVYLTCSNRCLFYPYRLDKKYQSNLWGPFLCIHFRCIFISRNSR